MKKLYDNIDEQSKYFFAKAKVSFSTSKEEAWEQMMQKMDDNPVPAQKQPKVIKMNIFGWTIAASVAILLGVGSFLKFYTTTITALPGQQLVYTLPDESIVDINAASSITYHPYWWQIERTIDFEGEAFFEVQKGSNFSVVSSKGTTEVLGTSFNISTRNNDYKVYCATGEVRVVDASGIKKAILMPNMYTSLNNGLEVVENVKEEEVVAWKNGFFNFKKQKLTEVLKTLERQYGITIVSKTSIDTLVYTGYFKKPKEPTDVLNLICKSFGISFEKEQNNYLIYQYD